MKRVDEPDTILMYDGHLARVVSIGAGKSIHMVWLDEPPCPTCGHQPGAYVLEHSPIFQNDALPVTTLRDERTF